jgi:hypothetical protein
MPECVCVPAGLRAAAWSAIREEEAIWENSQMQAQCRQAVTSSPLELSPTQHLPTRCVDRARVRACRGAAQFIRQHLAASNLPSAPLGGGWSSVFARGKMVIDQADEDGHWPSTKPPCFRGGANFCTLATCLLLPAWSPASQNVETAFFCFIPLGLNGLQPCFSGAQGVALRIGINLSQEAT